MTRYYLAGRYSRRDELREYARQLDAAGLGVVRARWLAEDHDWDGLDPAQAQQLAVDDLEDLAHAQAVLTFTDGPGTTRRGGRHVEYGLALALGKAVLIVGPAENVFHHAPGVLRVDAWPAALELLDSPAWHRELTGREPRAVQARGGPQAGHLPRPYDGTDGHKRCRACCWRLRRYPKESGGHGWRHYRP